MDFSIGSLHDLQTAAVYIGSAELEMGLHERINLIEAVEQSQLLQMAAVGNRLMEMMGIDESDALYQSFRSKTTRGLEIGSLVAGGYGAVKGVIGFTKLVRMPVCTSKVLSKTTNTNFQKIDKAVNTIEHFLGGKGKVITNADGDIILTRGNKKIRFDVKDPHGDRPHFHLEKQTPSGKWTDVTSEHRYYFKEV